MTLPELDRDKIKINSKSGIGSKIVVFKETSSTNDIAAEYSRNPENHGMLIMAETQTEGRGRFKKKWHDKTGQNILCSLVLIDCSVSASLLTLAIPLAVAHTIGNIAGKKPKIKWPNDIYIGNKKIAGILIETRNFAGHYAFITGIGINCHQKDFPDDLKNFSTGIDLETKTTCDRNIITKRLLHNIDEFLSISEKIPSKITKEWKKFNDQVHKRITLNYKGKKFSGYCQDVDPEKGLILRLDNGGMAAFDALLSSIEKNGNATY